MISPDEIKVQATRWWRPFLESVVRSETFFPRRIDRIGRIKPADVTHRFQTLQQQIETLYQHSKSRKGFGYTVITGERGFRRSGSHELPVAVEFETAADYVDFIGRKKDWQLFRINLEMLCSAIPSLRDWALQNCLWLTKHGIPWEDVFKVCRYFLANPRPDMYVRQLPVDVHTKFIEDHDALLQSLLNYLIPDHIQNPGAKRFAERYYLRYDQPLIRIRYLSDTGIRDGLKDISIPLSDFKQLDPDAKNVLITENKMNFLTLPALTSTIAIWSGGGFNISFLKDAAWLGRKNICYWGDIDEHGFQILHQLRSYYPDAKSVMMNAATFDQFAAATGVGSRSTSENLPLLTEEERALFDRLKSIDKNRLEQEKIPQRYADEQLNEVIGVLTLKLEPDPNQQQSDF